MPAIRLDHTTLGNNQSRGHAVATALTLAAILLAACVRTPQPPKPVPPLESPQVESIHFQEPLPEIAPLLPLFPRLRWEPAVPDEGNFVALLIEQAPTGIPVFEIRASAGDKPVGLVYLSGGHHLGLVAAPLNRNEVPVEIAVTLMDGTRLTQDLRLHVTVVDFPASRLSVAPRYTRPDAATLKRVEREREIISAMRERVTGTPLWDGAFVLPLQGLTTSPYGQRRVFNRELRSRHTGLDIDGSTGDPVRAANSGRVALSHDLFYNGQAVFIDHGLGLYTGYFHLSEREVVNGQWVEKGEIIGRVGATGRVTGPHLHWHLYLQGFSIDPRALLDPGFTAISGKIGNR
jgi:murein DD-endopeptidase MepM/ murein hydrolase activator NlpD